MPATTALKLVDYLTLFALIAGPAAAVGIQLWFERRREKRGAKIAVLSTLMAFRRRLTNPESVAALNRVQLVFNEDRGVLESHAKLIGHMERERSLPESERQQGWDTREDLLVELIASMAGALKYMFTHTNIKNMAYFPQGWVNEENDQQEIRSVLLPILKGDNVLRVRVEGDPPVK